MEIDLPPTANGNLNMNGWEIARTKIDFKLLMLISNRYLPSEYYHGNGDLENGHGTPSTDIAGAIEDRPHEEVISFFIFLNCFCYGKCICVFNVTKLFKS